MKKLTVYLFCIMSAIVQPSGLIAADKPLNVVATTPDFGAIVHEIGGKRVNVTVLAQAVEDVHFVPPKPSYIVKLAKADALIDGGAELEIGWLPPLLDGSRNTKLEKGKPGRIQGAVGVELMEVPASLDRAQGDIHAAGNPHFMTDPANGRIVAEHVCNALCALDGKSADFYRANLTSFTNRLEVKIGEWRKALEPHKGKRIVAYHNSWPYFARRFDLKIDLFLEPKPGIPPTPANLLTVQNEIKQQGIRAIMVEPYQNRKTAENVARATGATIVDVAQYPGGVKGTEGGYIELIDYLVNSLARALAGADATPAK